ncbi:hypothetical protein PoMZ_12007 [Pyricularia oryzae]|uniref:Uncharacterized protein n=1 Tax=Pyricularia oryzae TaxID=318829 RepID=A0A4P7NLQ0_PYROR|nr:hypothetical protein PoMZ_12007 [Pyricularia oryzae]
MVLDQWRSRHLLLPGTPNLHRLVHDVGADPDELLAPKDENISDVALLGGLDPGVGLVRIGIGELLLKDDLPDGDGNIGLLRGPVRMAVEHVAGQVEDAIAPVHVEGVALARGRGAAREADGARGLAPVLAQPALLDPLEALAVVHVALEQLVYERRAQQVALALRDRLDQAVQPVAHKEQEHRRGLGLERGSLFVRDAHGAERQRIVAVADAELDPHAAAVAHRPGEEERRVRGGADDQRPVHLQPLDDHGRDVWRLHEVPVLGDQVLGSSEGHLAKGGAGEDGDAVDQVVLRGGDHLRVVHAGHKVRRDGAVRGDLLVLDVLQIRGEVRHLQDDWRRSQRFGVPDGDRRGRRVDVRTPVVDEIKRVARHVEQLEAGLVVAVVVVPVDVVAPAVSRGHQLAQGRPDLASLFQSRNEAIRVLDAECLAHHGRVHGVGANLHPDGVLVRQAACADGLDRGHKVDGLPGLTGQVLGPEGAAIFDDAPEEGRGHGQPLQIFRDALHLTGVKAVLHWKNGRLDPTLFADGSLQVVDLFQRPTDHGCAGGVFARDAATSAAGNHLVRLAAADRQHQHAIVAGPAVLTQKPSAPADEVQRVAQGQDASGAQTCVLAQAVAHHHVGPETPEPQEVHQCRLQSHQGQLLLGGDDLGGCCCCCCASVLLLALYVLHDRREAVQVAQALGRHDAASKLRRCLKQLGCHSPVRRALSCKSKHDGARAFCRVFCPARLLQQQPAELFRVCHGPGRADIVLFYPACRGGIGQVGHGGVLVADEVVQDAAFVPLHDVEGVAGTDHNVMRPRVLDVLSWPHTLWQSQLGRGRGQNEAGVAPGGVEAVQDGLFARGKMLPAVGDVYMPGGQVRKLGVQPDGVDGVVEARLRRDDALVFENHGHLDERHDGGSGLGVPDVGLDGAEDELVVGGARATNHVGDGLDLAHVAGHGAGAVGLDVADVLGGGVGHAHGLVEDALLARLVRAEWLRAQPSTTPRILSPSSSASSSRFSTTDPTASPRQYPSTSSRKVLQLPVGDRNPPLASPAMASGEHASIDPPTTAVSQSPRTSDEHASAMATALDPHAASTVKAGPSHLK